MVVIATREAWAPNVDFARRSGRHGLQATIQKIDLCVGDGTADRRQPVRTPVGQDGPGRGHDGALGRTIIVDQHKRQICRWIVVERVASGQ